MRIDGTINEEDECEEKNIIIEIFNKGHLWKSRKIKCGS